MGAKRALISVFYKDGILDLARYLSGNGWEILSTGGTQKYLLENGVPVTDVSSVTGFPECLDGRVKTLHPRIHAGILAVRENAGHMDTLKEMDRILVFDDGKIIEQGTHETLLRRKGVYYKLYNMQADGFMHSDTPKTTNQTSL